MEDLNSLQKIKSFIEWCKNNKVKNFKQGELEFELSELSFISELEQPHDAPQSPEEAKLTNTQQSIEDEEDLFWSAN